MHGIAKKLFKAYVGTSPWKEHKGKGYRSTWPILNQLQQAGVLSSIDLALAAQLLEGGDSQESVAAAICYVSLAARQGHLCIGLHASQLAPSLSELTDQMIPAPLSEQFLQLVMEGITNLPSSLTVQPIRVVVQDERTLVYWSDIGNMRQNA